MGCQSFLKEENLGTRLSNHSIYISVLRPSGPIPRHFRVPVQCTSPEPFSKLPHQPARKLALRLAAPPPNLPPYVIPGGCTVHGERLPSGQPILKTPTDFRPFNLRFQNIPPVPRVWASLGAIGNHSLTRGHRQDVIASAAKQSPSRQVWRLFRCFTPRNDMID